MNYKKTLIIYLIVLTKTIISQNDSSRAVIYFKEKAVVIYLDGEKILPSKKLRYIAIGSHVIKAWAPKYTLFNDTFVVKKGNNEFYTRKLELNEAYKTYKNNLRLQRLSYSLPALLSVISSSIYYSIYQNFDTKINTTRREAIVLQDTYNHSFTPEEFEKNKTDYFEKNNYYNKLKDQQNSFKTQGIVIGASLLATAVILFVIQKLKKHIPYSEAPLLTKIIPYYNPSNNQLCLSLKLNL